MCGIIFVTICVIKRAKNGFSELSIFLLDNCPFLSVVEKKIYIASLITSMFVIPAKAGIQDNTGFRVKPGMTNYTKLMPSYIASSRCGVLQSNRGGMRDEDV
jgi:hypothetical protein